MSSKPKIHNFPLHSLIGGFYIEKDICDDLISFFNKSKHLHFEGTTGFEQTKDYELKQSIEISQPVSFFNTTFPKYTEALQNCLKSYFEMYEHSNTDQARFDIIQNVKIQYYDKGWGYKIWHKENTGEGDEIRRHLVFMTYLNDVENGGTEFLYQNLTAPAKKGLTLIWPAAWTHTHRGQITDLEEKYIITGWYSYT